MAAVVVFVCVLAGEVASFVGMTSGLAGASFTTEAGWMAVGCALFVAGGIAALMDRRSLHTS